jgi:1-acyl-sn-glycerol-3-phosphate acyltransferase
MFRPIYRLIFWIAGWKIKGKFPDLKKFVVAVAPHTSNWDFVVGVMARSILHLESAKFLGKDSLFQPPFGWFFRWLGGYPVDRKNRNDMTEQVAGYFANHDHFILAMAPEGTRKKVEELRTGFYYIAKKANVPIVPVGFDFSIKTIIIGQPILPSDDMEKDMNFLLSFYRQVKGKNPAYGL